MATMAPSHTLFLQFQSLIYFLLANALILLTFSIPKRLPRAILLPPWALFALSFLTLHRLPWSVEFLSNIGSYLVIATILWPIRLSTKNNLAIAPKSLRDLYLLYANPRFLPPSQSSSPLPWKSRINFFFLRHWHIFLLILLRYSVILIIAFPLSQTTIHSFSPQEASLSAFTLSSLPVRLSVVAYWLVEGLVPLQVVHFTLSTVAVLLGDDPGTWPPLFGSPLEAYSLRRFWGRFWHQLLSPGARIWAGRLVERLGIKRARGLVMAGVVFVISGVAHMATAWRLGDRCWEVEGWFWGVSFLGCVAEVVVVKGARQLRVTGGKWWRVLGYAWVLGFFAWAVPGHMYPRIYDALTERKEIGDVLGHK